MWARFIRFMVWPDTAYKQKPVAERGSEYFSNTKLDKDPALKIYCQGCKWLVRATSGFSCRHESNKIFTKGKKAEWYSPDLDHSLREHPKQKNRRNDCPYREISESTRIKI